MSKYSTITILEMEGVSMDSKTWYIVSIIIGATIIFIGMQLYKKHLVKKFFRCLQQRDFDTFFKATDCLASKYFFPYFNRLYMKLNAYIIMPDQKKVEETFEELLKLRLNKKQNLDVSIKAFYYYVDEGSKKKCKELLERIKGLENETAMQECQMIFDIFLDKKANYIEDMEAQLKDAEGVNKGMLYYMLGMQYDNLGNQTKGKEYMSEALTFLKGTPYEMKITEMMN